MPANDISAKIATITNLIYALCLKLSIIIELMELILFTKESVLLPIFREALITSSLVVLAFSIITIDGNIDSHKRFISLNGSEIFFEEVITLVDRCGVACGAGLPDYNFVEETKGGGS